MSTEAPVEARSLPRESALSSANADTIGNRVLAYALLGVVGGFLLSRYHPIAEAFREDWPQLVFWMALVVVVNLFPVWLGEFTFTMDMPLLLTLAFLYPPEVAAFVALVASLDVREILGRVSVPRALFNRAQISVMVFAAGSLFRATAPGLSPWPKAIAATLAAIAVSFALNVFLVALYTGMRVGKPLSDAVRSLTQGRLGEFAATYMGYCGLALVLAYLLRDVGAWSVVLFLAPTLVAQLMLTRGRRLQTAAEELKNRERLLENLSDRIVDERRDERLRIAADLHDDVVQSLIHILQLGRFLRGETESGSQAFRDATELAELTEETLTELRHVVGDLRYSPLGRGGLIPTLQGLARDLRFDWRTKITVMVPDEVKLMPEQQVAALLTSMWVTPTSRTAAAA